MYQRMTGEVREVCGQAMVAARRLRHQRMGSEHLLLALVASGARAADPFRAQGLVPERVARVVDELAASPPGSEADRQALAAIGIDLDLVRSRVEAAFGRGALDRPRPRRPLLNFGRRRAEWLCERSRPPVGRDAQAVLESSLRRALARHERHVGLEHLALALLARRGGGAATVIDRLGARR